MTHTLTLERVAVQPTQSTLERLLQEGRAIRSSLAQRAQTQERVEKPRIAAKETTRRVPRTWVD